MALSCGRSLLKILVFFFDALVFIGGIVCSGFGIYLIVEVNKTAGAVWKGLPIFILVIGLLIFLLGFQGCVGAYCENIWMLKLFAIILGILLLGEIIGGILVLVYRHEDIKDKIEGLDKLELGQEKELRKALDSMQKELKCCGGVGPSDWKKPPVSCSFIIDSACAIFKIGCAKAMYELIVDNALVVGVVMVGMCLLQIGAIVFSVCLSKKIGSYESV